MSKTFEALQKAEEEKRQVNFGHSENNNGTSPTSFNLDVRIAEELKNMQLFIRSKNDKIKTILFTASNPGEGTSTLLINFAKQVAQSGEKVLIVDTNLRNPKLHLFLNVENTEGITQAIEMNKPLIQTIKKTATQNLMIITCGKQNEGAFTGFSSNTIKRVINETKAHADWVLFDSPPIHKYSDATVLATGIDGVIMVVQAEKTKWEIAQNARDKIKERNAQILGAILNKKKFHIPKLIYKLVINQ